MNILYRSRLFIGFTLLFIAVLVLAIAWPATAGTQADSFSYLPFVSNKMAVQLDEYDTNFKDNIEPWKAVRWRKDADFSLAHSSACDGDRCGFLNMGVKMMPGGAAVIASPLIKGPKAPYSMHMRAKFEELKDKNQYGLVFGGDWSGAPCPGDNVDGCFNHHYEVRIRYRDALGEQYMEYRIRRIDEYDSSGKEKGVDLLNWTRVDGLDSGGWIKWEVFYGANGEIVVAADNKELPGLAQDDTFVSDRFFGVFARSVDTGDTKTVFDNYRITKQVEEYETDFTDSIEPWKAVRWRNNAEYSAVHDSGCEGERCGFLDVGVKTMTGGAAVIVSPLIPSPKTPYNMHFRAKFQNIKDKNQYGMAFGGDWNGAPCPGSNVDGCFNHYYEVRIRYRNSSGEQFMEYRIRRIDGHDSEGKQQGVDLLEWTRVDGLDNEGWIKWEVRYGSNGEIKVFADNAEQSGSAQDDTYLASPYFGVFARAVETGDTEARFDKFRVTKEE